MGAAVDLGYPPNVQGAGRADIYAALRGRADPATSAASPAPGAPEGGGGCLPPVLWKQAARR